MMLKLRKQRGFTLVELMIVVAIIGILAALAVYGVRRYITSTKTAEAREILGRIGKDAVAAHSREQMAGTLLAADGTAAAVNRFCPTAAKLPADTPANAKVQTDPADWKSDEGWRCLRFSVNDPTYYAYEYVLSDASNFEARAHGDLDADGDDTVFLYRGGLLSGVARLAPSIIEPEDEANTLNEDDDEL